MPWRSQKWEQTLLFFTEDVQGQSLQTQMLKNAIIIHSKEKNSQNYNVHAIYGNVLRSGWPNSDMLQSFQRLNHNFLKLSGISIVYCFKPNCPPILVLFCLAYIALWKVLMGVLHLLPKLACFVLYLKIINNFLKTKLCIL